MLENIFAKWDTKMVTVLQDKNLQVIVQLQNVVPK